MKLSNICKIISGGTPKTSCLEYWNGDIPWISIKDFIQVNRFVKTTEKTITELGLSNSATNLLSQDDIIISARGTVGKVALIKKPMTFNQSCYGIRCDKSQILPHYLFYWLKSNTNKILSGTHGSVFDTITRDDFDRLDIWCPNLETQRHIIDTIGSVDNLIENNNEIITKIKALKQCFYNKAISNAKHKSILKDYINIETGSMNLIENNPDGEYLFYTRNEGVFRANKYTHNQKGVIVAGEGNFNPKFANGKFGLHQRAYVLSTNNNLITDEILFQIVSSNVEYLNNVAVGSTVKSLRKNSFENMPFYLDGNYEQIKNKLLNLQKLEEHYNKTNDELIKLKQLYLKKYFG